MLLKFTFVSSEYGPLSAYTAFPQLHKLLVLFQISPGITSSGKVSLALSSETGLQSWTLWSHQALYSVTIVYLLIYQPYKPQCLLKVETTCSSPYSHSLTLCGLLADTVLHSTRVPRDFTVLVQKTRN